ncbi:MAG: cell division protein FtsA [Patescibacteria group bacterium]
MSTVITGLDIGSSSIRGVVCARKKDGGLLVLTAFRQPSAGIRKGVMVDVEEATCVLRDIVLDLAKTSKKATRNVFVNASSEHSRAHLSRGIAAVARADQVIQQDDVDRVLQASKAVKLPANYLVLHNITREYFVDDVGYIADPVGMVGNRLEVSTLIVEAFAPQVNLLGKNVERVGARVGGLIFNPLAAARAVLTKRQKDLGVLMVDIGFGTTTFAVFEESKVLHTRCIPIGSGHVTSDLAIGLKVPFDAAEKIKMTYGCALAKEISRKDVVKLSEVDAGNTGEVPRRFIAEIIEVRLSEILELVSSELKTLGRSVQLPAGVVVTGAGAKLPSITDLVKQELKLTAHTGFPILSSLDIPNQAHQELLDDPGFSTAIGLALWGNAEKEGTTAPAMNFISRFLKNLMP